MARTRTTPRKTPPRLRIRAEREARGWTLEDLAGKLNVARQTIGRWETGERDVGASTLFEIAAALDIPVRLLFPGDDGLQADERNMLDVFRAAPPHEKRAMLTMANTLHEGRQAGFHSRGQQK